MGRTSPTTRSIRRRCRPPGRFCPWPASGRWAPSARTSRGSTSGRRGRDARPSATTASTPTSRRPLTWPCARPPPPCTRRSAASPSPLRFVVSMGLGDPASFEPVRRRLERYPDLRFKLDARSDWTPELIARLQATGSVEALDLKGLYEGSPVDQGADPVLYERVGAGLPRGGGSRTRASTRGRSRSSRRTATASRGTPTFTASPTSRPSPSRRGSSTSSRRAWAPCASSFAAYAYCEERGGAGVYGGGQLKLGRAAGRSSTWRASFTPTRPTTSPLRRYNHPDVPDGLPVEPALAPDPSASRLPLGLLASGARLGSVATAAAGAFDGSRAAERGPHRPSGCDVPRAATIGS